MEKADIIKIIKGNLIVSCQSLPNEPLYLGYKNVMPLMARALKRVGACAIRINDVLDVVEIKKETKLPIIGLIKQSYEVFEPYITPTMKEIDTLIEAKADVIELDCTLREHPGGKSIEELIHDIKQKYSNVLLMPDVSIYEEGVNATRLGVDFVGRTLRGYTPYTELNKADPNFKLVKQLSKNLDIQVLRKVKYTIQSRLKRCWS